MKKKSTCSLWYIQTLGKEKSLINVKIKLLKLSGILAEGVFCLFLYMPLQIFDFDLELQYKFIIGWFFLFDIILQFSHIDNFAVKCTD